MKIERKTQPAIEPVTLDELKADRRITWTDDDAYITECGIAAREILEEELSRSFITTTWTYYNDFFIYDQDYYLTLPIARANTINSIKYYLRNNEYTITDYQFSPGQPGRVAPLFGAWWPFTYGELDSVQIEFVAGYGDTADKVPACIKKAIKLIAGHLYETREAVAMSSIGYEIPFTVSRLVNREKWRGF